MSTINSSSDSSYYEANSSPPSPPQNPQPFTGHNNQSKESVETFKPQRRRSISSLDPNDKSFVSSLKKTISHSSSNRPSEENSTNYKDYSAKNLYGEDLDANEIELKRTQTKATIINTLEERVANEYQDSKEQDIEAYQPDTTNQEQRSHRSKSIYSQVDREEALPTLNDGVEFQEIDPELVTWDGDDDPQNPRNWSSQKKWISIAVVSFYTLLSPFASTMLSPAVSSISQEFGNTNETISALMVSIFILAWALIPPFVAPLSEMYGRKIVLDVSIWVLMAFNIGCAVSQTTTQMIVCRFFAGVGGAASIVIGAGTISDTMDVQERGLAMSIYSLGPTMGPCMSALIAGYIVEYASWRWCFWVLVIFNGVIGVLGNIFLRETYAPVLLKRKASKLRKLTGNENLHSLYEIATGETTFDKFYVNLSRPILLLCTHPMVFGLGIFMAIGYGCLYILIVTFPAVWGQIYGFNKGSTGLMYLTFLIGYLIGIIFFNQSAKYVLNKLIAKNNGVAKPEFRLPLLLFSGVTLPMGLFWYGWGAEHQLHYMFTAVGASIFAFGVIAIFYCIQNYLIDMNPRFAASSIAAASIFRSFLGFAFPLFAPEMFRSLGYGWGCSVFGFIALATGIPFPLFVILYGEKLRIWANKRIERSQAKRDAKNLARLKKIQERQLNEKKPVNEKEVGNVSSQSS
ncbi:Polyamine transporter 3 [Wickerhamomyces ciferrii]|uniref:Polyamine transporter 3 n=1 Tax=Wickerhamomyces ciferrii (strain ATCC 14091 / BCRC 22168 / CBS 111 / JCM 3599 / NBRC 0793 / NRRL Y-1031 F-60-10) TaxID=1206466 RepID=K0KLI5_WICCF|nr:Polyamine transporter 3 [Wickerhamomyces ciferrii]CCH43077.1 Polyamine transporter 3 [Wickerhamomyces ciferrii]